MKKITKKMAIEAVREFHEIYSENMEPRNIKEYAKVRKKHGWPSKSVIKDRLGGWVKAQRKAGITVTKYIRVKDRPLSERLCNRCPEQINCDKLEDQVQECLELAKEFNWEDDH